MKRIIIALAVFLLAIVYTPNIKAASDFIKPTSKLYFIQTIKEQIQLFFKFSKEQKIDYLLSLTEKRVEETSQSPTPSVLGMYEEHYEKLNSLAAQVEDKKGAEERIREANLSQQGKLSRVYVVASDAGKNSIEAAQENTSKGVAKTVEAVEGVKEAQTYTRAVQKIIQAEKLGQVEQVEMEQSPNSNPDQTTIKEIKGGNPTNSLNVIQEGQGGGSGGTNAGPAVQIQMVNPGGGN